MNEETNVVAVEEIAAAVQAAGVTGAGGAGFPTHVKFRAQAEIVLANGAECEPLTHVDKQLMIHHAPQVVAGLRAAIRATGAERGIIGVKAKSKEAIASLRRELQGAEDITIAELGNFYPSGDEQVMVYDVLGRIVPEGGIPLDVGVVVNNVETLYNVSQALEGRPVTHKYVTVIGEVARPMTVRVPIGVSIGEVIALAGGATVPNPLVLDGGAMMGHIAGSLDDRVTKRTKILLVLPFEHELSVQRRRPRSAFELRAISACDQCYFCTDYCPRHAQGHRIQPHKLILLLASGVPLTDEEMSIAMLCCECRTCNYACPVHLQPADIAIAIKHDLIKGGLKNPYHDQTGVNPFRDFRRVPLNRLQARLGLTRYNLPAPLTDVPATFPCVRLLLHQHTGAPARPVVRPGDHVAVGDLVGEIPEGALGARVHASIAGVVTSVTSEAVTVEANGHG